MTGWTTRRDSRVRNVQSNLIVRVNNDDNNTNHLYCVISVLIFFFFFNRSKHFAHNVYMKNVQETKTYTSNNPSLLNNIKIYLSKTEAEKDQ